MVRVSVMCAVSLGLFVSAIQCRAESDPAVALGSHLENQLQRIDVGTRSDNLQQFQRQPGMGVAERATVRSKKEGAQKSGQPDEPAHKSAHKKHKHHQD